jgi:hypothetical protein
MSDSTDLPKIPVLKPMSPHDVALVLVAEMVRANGIDSVCSFEGQDETGNPCIVVVAAGKEPVKSLKNWLEDSECRGYMDKVRPS